MTKDDLKPDEYNIYYKGYVDKTTGLDLKEGLKISGDDTINFLEAIELQKLEYRYEEGKWTIKEIIQHLIDTERIFSYRALRIARQDQTALPGFDQDEFADHSHANARSIDDLMNDYKAVRLSTLILFDSFSEAMLSSIGTASNSAISVRALAFIIMGHELHHCQIIKERYL